jgi:hypothetical protein
MNFSIGELDLAISDYSTALEIDSKNNNSTTPKINGNSHNSNLINNPNN